MKKFFAMLLALSMALGMTACGGSSSSSDSDSSQSGDAASGDKVVRIGVFEPATGDFRRRRQAGDAGYAVCKPHHPYGGHRR